MSMRNMLRNAIYRTLGAISGPGRGLRFILLYHSVGEDAPHSVPAPIFEGQMRSLIRRFQVVRVQDLAESLRDADPDANLACVTFDDGYLDNHQVALPILDRYKIRATFFISTGYLGDTFRTSAGPYPMMSAEQVRDLHCHGHEVGAHTVSHPKLTRIPLDQAAQEISTSKSYLEKLIGQEISSFAYPRGDTNQEIRKLVERNGFRFAVTVEEGSLPSDPDWLALPRLWIHNRFSLKAFESRLSPASRWWAALRSRIS